MPSQTAVAPQGSASATPSTPANALIQYAPAIVICGIFYMLLFRPQQQREKERKKMIDQLKVGDRIMTQGGLYGTVAGIKGEVVQVKIADGVKVDMHRTAIGQVVTKENSNGVQAVTSGERS